MLTVDLVLSHFGSASLHDSGTFVSYQPTEGKTVMIVATSRDSVSGTSLECGRGGDECRNCEQLQERDSGFDVATNVDEVAGQAWW